MFGGGNTLPPVLYVASDRAGAGKTSLCATLASLLEDQGKQTAVFEPMPGPLSGVSGDADILIAEGNSSLSHEEAGKLIDEMDAVVLAVIGYRRDLSADDLAVWRERHGDRLVGFVINGLTRYLGTEISDGLLSEARSRGLAVLGVVPEDRRLLGVTVAQLSRHLSGSFLVDGESAGGLVEHFMVGCMGMDPGETHFGLKENEAAIIRGDRPDIQMAALATSPTCLVLTKGIEPIEYVMNEAQLEEVPVISVATDTLTTMDAVADVIGEARFDHPLKLERYRELVEENGDLTAIFGRLGLETEKAD